MEGEVGEEYFCEALPLRTLHKDGGGVGLGVFCGEIQGARGVRGEGGKGRGGRAGGVVEVVHVAYIGKGLWRARSHIFSPLIIIIISFPNSCYFLRLNYASYLLATAHHVSSAGNSPSAGKRSCLVEQTEAHVVVRLLLQALH